LSQNVNQSKQTKYQLHECTIERMSDMSV